MSRFDLRDVSERLTRSRSTESVISEFLRSLESMRPDWRGTLAFYEVSRDALVDVYELDRGRLLRRGIVVPLDRLPHRLVKKLFHSGAFFHETDRSSLLAKSGPVVSYEAGPREASDLQPLTPLAEWQSCVCLPLGYQDDLIALLTLVSPKKDAFGGRAMSEIVPLKSIATVALAQHLYRSARQLPPPADAEAEEPLNTELERLRAHAAELEQEGTSGERQVESLMQEIESLDRTSSTYKEELERVKRTVLAMEENSSDATERLAEAYQRLQSSQWTLNELEHTVAVLKDAFHTLAEPRDPGHLLEGMMDWFCDRFGVRRCSFMVPDERGETLRIGAFRGIDAQIAARVRVRFGQGVAGWVARHRKPLFVRVREDARTIPRSPDGTYNHDSFVVVPLVHRGRLHGVMSLSNRLDGEGFSEVDLDRAVLVASAFAARLGARETARRSAAWA